MKEILIFILCSVICSAYCFSQKRKTIDRTHKPKAEKVTTKRNPSRTSSAKQVRVRKTKRISSRTKVRRTSRPLPERNFLDVSSDYLRFPSEGGKQTVKINSGLSWEIGDSTYGWGHLKTDGDAVTVHLDINTTPNSRTDYFTIKSGNLEKRINIFQSECTVQPEATISAVRVKRTSTVDSTAEISIKVSFRVTGMKKHKGMVACYFYDSTGMALVAGNKRYSSKDGKVCVSELFYPEYDNQGFKEFELKIPCKELHMSLITHMILRVDVIIGNFQFGEAKELTRKRATVHSILL